MGSSGGSGDTTITAKVVLDVSELEAEAQSAEQSLQAMGASTAEAAKGLDEVGSSAETSGKGLSTLGTSGEEASKGLSEVASSGEEASKGLSTIGQSGKEAAEGLASMDRSAGESASSAKDVGNASEEAGSKVKKTGQAAKESGESFGSMAMNFLNNAQQIQQAAMLVGQAIAAIGQQAADLQNATSALDNMTKNAGMTEALMSQLAQTGASKDFGAKAVNASATQLLQMGKQASATVTEIQALSDGIAKNGGNAAMLSPVIDQIEKIGKAGRVTESDIDALDKAGLNGIQALADGWGVTVPQALEKLNHGAVSGKEAYDTMFKGLNQDIGATTDQSKQLGAEWSRMTGDMATDLKPVADALASLIGTMADAIEQYGLFGGLTASFTPDPNTAGPSGTSTVVSSFGGHADGGSNLPEGWSMIGEKGPELMYIPGGSSILPNSSLQSGGSSSLSSLPAMGNSSGPMTVQVVLDSRILAEQTFPHMAPMIRVMTGRRA